MYVHVLDLSTMVLYIFPSARFKYEEFRPRKNRWGDNSNYEMFFFSVFGLWRRTFVKKHYVSPKKLSQKNFVWYSKTQDGGSIYAALWFRNMLVYIPPGKDVEQFLLLFLSTLVKAGGTLADDAKMRPPTSTASSYDVCHRVAPNGMCDKYLSHARFCRIAGIPSDSKIFASPEFIGSATTLPLNSVFYMYPESNDRLILDGTGEPVWKHYCTVCAYPHKVFGMLIEGHVYCGEKMPLRVSEHCKFKESGTCSGECARVVTDQMRSDAMAVARYVTHYGGSYMSSDSLFPDFEVSYFPSFGHQFIYYISKAHAVGALSSAREVNICTCMLSNVPCDSLVCYKKKLIDDNYTRTDNGMIFSCGVNVIIPDNMDPEQMFITPDLVTVPTRMLEQLHNSHLMCGGGFSLYDYMFSPHVEVGYQWPGD